jgi:hypothetical protein
MTQIWPARRFKPRLIVKTIADSGTPEALGTNQRMQGLTFFANKAVGTPNVGTVTIQVDGVDAWIMESGSVYTWPSPPYEAGYYFASDFTIKVATNGDGVVVVYSELQ